MICDTTRSNIQIWAFEQRCSIKRATSWSFHFFFALLSLLWKESYDSLLPCIFLIYSFKSSNSFHWRLWQLIVGTLIYEFYELEVLFLFSIKRIKLNSQDYVYYKIRSNLLVSGHAKRKCLIHPTFKTGGFYPYNFIFTIRDTFPKFFHWCKLHFLKCLNWRFSTNF